MSKFKNEKVIPIRATDLEPVARELEEHFQQRGFDVHVLRTSDVAWQVDITRGNMFKAALGLRTALQITVDRHPAGTKVNAGTGIFGKQAVPTAISVLVAWPVLLTQAWGLIRQANLDDEAIRVVEMTLSRIARLEGTGTGGNGSSTAAGSVKAPFGAQEQPGFCPSCGGRVPAHARFCSECGAVQSVVR